MPDDENSIENRCKKTSSQSIYEDVFFSNYIAWIFEERENLTSPGYQVLIKHYGR